MAITSSISKAFKQQIMMGVHGANSNPAKTYKMALFTASASLDANTVDYTTSNEVSDANYTAGGATCANYTTSLDGTTAVLTFNNVTWANSTFTARGCMIYSNNANNNVVGVWDFGNNVTGGGGNFTVNMPVANNTTGLVRIA